MSKNPLGLKMTGLQRAPGKLIYAKRKLRALAKAIALDMLEPIEDAARAYAPRATGALASQIYRKPWKKAGFATVGTSKATDYGAHVEFGTKAMLAENFMHRAYDTGKLRAEAIAVNMARHAINFLLS
jgi:HK97 gp10 family phage protein